MFIRRLPFLMLVILASLGLVSIVLAAAGQAHEPVDQNLADTIHSPANQTILSVPSPRKHAAAAPLASLQLQVNYGHDWVAGFTDIGASVAVTITDSSGAIKNETVLSADASGYFSTDCANWSSGTCPDIRPGDIVTATVPGAVAGVNPVGSIIGTPNPDSDVVTGTLTTPWLSNPTTVFCQVWADPGSDQIETTANPNGENFNCDFVDVAWDLQFGDMVAIGYYEEDGDQVINMVEWPWMRVNYAHDWVGGNYDLGHTFWITVTESDGTTVKGTTETNSTYDGGWDGDGFTTSEFGWTPNVPDILTGDRVYFLTDNGYTQTLNVGLISASLDVENDELNGQVFASGFSENLEIECHPWGAWEIGLGDAPIKYSSASPDGKIPFSCEWDPINEWDIQPGQDLAVMYIEPDMDRVIDIYRISAPDLGIWKWHNEGYARPGGVVVYGIHFRNDGDGPAENVFITDTLPTNTTYSSDTSGFPVMVGPDDKITWDLGTINPAESVYFFVTLNVDADLPIGQEIIGQNCALITTSTAGDWDPGNDSSCSAAVDIWEDEVDLSVRKWAEPSDPHPGQEFDYWIEWCNLSGAAAGPVTMTDTLPVGVSLLSWEESEAWMHFWTEVSASDEQLVLYAPGLPSNRCEMINVRVSLDASVSIPTKLVNLVDLAVGSDVNPENNWWVDDSAFASPPRYDLAIEKELGEAVMVPGGYVDFWLRYRNQGNIETTVHITDTLPAGLSYVSGVWSGDTPWTGESIPDPTIIDNQLVWDLPAVGINEQHGFSIRLAVDGGVVPIAYLVNCAQIAGDGPEASPADNTTCTSFSIQPSGPNLQVEKWSEWHGEGQLGYTIRLANTGDQAESDVWITDTLPVGVAAAGWPVVHFDDQRTVETLDETGSGRWLFNFSEIFPGESAFINFNVDLLEPGTPLRWFTNTVEISTPFEDTIPADNFHQDTAFSGGEVKRVEMWLNPDVVSHLWGEAVSGTPVTVTTPSASYFTIAEPECGGCWAIDITEPLGAGDLITVSAGAGLHPVAITIPDPFDVQASSTDDHVWGQIDHLDQELVEVDMYGGPMISSQTDGNGFFDVAFIDIPQGAEGEVLYETEVDYVEVVFHRYWRSPDLTLNINYGHDWVEGLYEQGHTVWITVTESDGYTVKGTAELGTEFIPDWDRSGFSTDWGGWSSDRPDIVPGDWVLAQIDNGYTSTYTSTVQVGLVGISVDYPANVVTGTFDFPDYIESSDLLEGNCEIWGVENGPRLHFRIAPAGGQVNCDFNLIGWNIDKSQTVAVSYFEPDGHRVMNTADGSQIIFLPVALKNNNY